MQERGEKIWKCPQYILSSVNLAKLKLLSTQFIHSSTQISALQSQQQTIEIKDFKTLPPHQDKHSGIITSPLSHSEVSMLSSNLEWIKTIATFNKIKVTESNHCCCCRTHEPNWCSCWTAVAVVVAVVTTGPLCHPCSPLCPCLPLCAR